MFEKMKTLVAFLSSVPDIIRIVHAIEQVIPIPGQGKAKLDLILSIVESLADQVAGLDIGVVKDKITGIVELVVKLFNTVGLFKKT